MWVTHVCSFDTCDWILSATPVQGSLVSGEMHFVPMDSLLNKLSYAQESNEQIHFISITDFNKFILRIMRKF